MHLLILIIVASGLLIHSAVRGIDIPRASAAADRASPLSCASAKVHRAGLASALAPLGPHQRWPPRQRRGDRAGATPTPARGVFALAPQAALARLCTTLAR